MATAITLSVKFHKRYIADIYCYTMDSVPACVLMRPLLGVIGKWVVEADTPLKMTGHRKLRKSWQQVKVITC